MISVTTIAGILVLAVAGVALAKFAKNTIMTMVTVAGIIVGLLLIFGPANIPGLSDYIGPGVLQDLIPGTGDATYSPYNLDVTELSQGAEGNLMIEVENTGDLELVEFMVQINGQDYSVINSAVLPEESTSLVLSYKPVDGDQIIVSSYGAKDSETF